MAHATASAPSASQIWQARAKTVGTWVVIAAVALLLGMFVFGPNRLRAQPNYVPQTYVDLPTGIISLAAADGPTLVLPVRIADTTSARLSGFAGVGAQAIDNQFLLYAQSRQMPARTGYAVDKANAPLSFAAIDAEGQVLSITNSTAGQARVTIPEGHRWALAAKAGTFEHYGIEPGMTLDIEDIRKINL